MAVVKKECGRCGGSGEIEVCRNRHSGPCDCLGMMVECPDCDGYGVVPVTEEDDDADP